MNKKISIAFVVLAIFVFNGLSLPFCSSNKEQTAVENPSPSPTVTLNDKPLATADATIYDATITANYEQAGIAAIAWNKDARLVMVSVKIPNDLSLDNSTDTYTYGSVNQPNYWWTYSLSESTGKTVRALVNKEDYLGTNVEPIPKSFWRTNYIEAFQIAENYGGKEFRQNNQNVSISLTLSVTEPKKWLWWLVEYKTPLGETLSVRINPNDQTIVDEAGEVVTTGSAYSPTESTDATKETITETGTLEGTVTSTPTPGATTTETYSGSYEESTTF